MKKILLILSVLCTLGHARAQIEAPQILDFQYAKFKPQPLIFLVSIDREICQDVINGKFFIKDNTGKQIDQLAFSAWTGRLEMSNRDYKKLFKVSPQDSIYVVFGNNNFKLDTDYIYEARIPHEMINNKYLILNIFNQKEEENSKKYVFRGDKGYVIQVQSPGVGTLLKLVIEK